MGIRSILLLAAVVLFILGTFGVDLGDVDLLFLGLACMAGAFLVGDVPIGRRRV